MSWIRKLLPADVTLIDKIGEALYETQDSKEYGACLLYTSDAADD